MRMLFLSNMFPSEEFPSFGTFVKVSYEQMIDNGFKVDKVVIQKTNNKKISKIMKYLKFYYTSIKKICKGGYNIVYVHYISHSSIPIILTKKKGYVISNIHGTDVLPKKVFQKLFLPIVKKTIKKSDLLVVPSEYYKKIVIEKYNVDEKKIFVSPSGGINPNTFFLKNHKKYSDSVLRIGYASRIVKDKGWDTFIEAIEAIQSDDYEFSIVGSGDMKKRMMEYIDCKGLSDKINVKGSLSQSELREYFENLDCFIFPSKSESESLGLVGLEAMACGCPVIGAKNGGITSYVNDGYNGFIFKKGDSRDLANKIEIFRKLSSEKKRELSENAVNTSKKYAENEVGKLLNERIRRLINDGQ